MFCPYCGYRMKDDHLFCKNCGKKVENDAESKVERSQTTSKVSKTLARDIISKAESDQTTTTMPKVFPETVLAGFSSADMLRPGSIGYGIYITNKRVIGIKKPEQFAKAVSGAIAGAIIGKMLGFEAPWAVSSALGRNLTNDETMHLLTELEKNKDFEIDRRDITLVQLKEPFLIGLGHLAIFVKGEKTTNYAIKFSKDNVNEMLKEMFKTHFPQVFQTMI